MLTTYESEVLVLNRDDYCRLFLDSIDSTVYAVDIKTYDMVFANKRLLGLLEQKGITDIIGTKCYKTLRGRETPCEVCLNAVKSEDGCYHWDSYNEVFDQYFTAKARIVRAEDKKIAYVTIQNATNFYLEKKKIENNLKIERALFECAKTLDNDDVNFAFNKLFEVVTKHFNGDRTYMFEIDEDGTTVSNTYEYVSEGVSKEIDNLQKVPVDVIGWWFRAFEEKGSIYISNVSEDTDKNSVEYELLSMQNIQSLIAAPIIVNGKMIGFFGVDNPRGNQEEGIEFLMTISHFINNYLERRKTMLMLSKMSYEDKLTGIFNRNKYNEKVDYLKKNKPQSLGVLFIDLNGLKKANDTFGHNYGDDLLKNTATKIKEIFGESTYRIGGDEFIVICENVSKEAFVSNQMRLIYSFAQKDIYASMGLSWETGDEVDIKVQLLAADKRMYIEKAEYYKSKIAYGGGI